MMFKKVCLSLGLVAISVSCAAPFITDQNPGMINSPSPGASASSKTSTASASPGASPTSSPTASTSPSPTASSATPQPTVQPTLPPTPVATTNRFKNKEEYITFMQCVYDAMKAAQVNNSGDPGLVLMGFEVLNQLNASRFLTDATFMEQKATFEGLGVTYNKYCPAS